MIGSAKGFSLNSAKAIPTMEPWLRRIGKSEGRGSWLVLAEYDENYKVKQVKTVKVDGKKIKGDTFYQLKRGKFVEAK